ALTSSPATAPPEILRQVRSSLFQALAQCWDQVLRSPEFLECLKPVMDNSAAFQKASTDLLAKVRHEWGGVTREDCESLVDAVSRLEKRVFDGFGTLSRQVEQLNGRLDLIEGSKATSTTPASAVSGSGKRRTRD